jgi:hypothetical protein
MKGQVLFSPFHPKHDFKRTNDDYTDQNVVSRSNSKMYTHAQKCLRDLSKEKVSCSLQSNPGSVQSKLQNGTRNGIWPDSADNATLLSSIMMTKDFTKSSYELCFGKKTHSINKLKIFGEMCEVTTMSKFKK